MSVLSVPIKLFKGAGSTASGLAWLLFKALKSGAWTYFTNTFSEKDRATMRKVAVELYMWVRNYTPLFYRFIKFVVGSMANFGGTET